MTSSNVPALFAALCLALGVGGCNSSGTNSDGPMPPAPGPVDLQAGPAVVVGTVIDAATAAPIGGATVTGPDGSTAVTDASGRFRLKGMAHGTSGELQAVAGDLQGAVLLRPLAGGRLEVVLHLR